MRAGGGSRPHPARRSATAHTLCEIARTTPEDRGHDAPGKMSSIEKALVKILRGASDASITFRDLRNVLSALGFQERIRGSHHIFTKEGVEEILNLQPKHGKAKSGASS
jgi:predicted RNA binding protein YcfA (HicA-like mRNA interferase family)